MINFFSSNNILWNKYGKLINSINLLENELQTLENDQLKERTFRLKNKLILNNNGNLSNDILVESFALVRESAKRTIGLRHYDTQLLGGLILNEGKIAEMCTGEGKTLVATAPTFANALSGQGAHVITVNEYLAQRDAEGMGQIYRLLGLQVGLIKSNMSQSERRKNYNRDITYVTNSEVGFDFLRDNLVTQIRELVQRPFNFAIIDEVDSILIDEARTPLIISQQVKIDIEKIVKASEIVKFLINGFHYDIDEKAKNVSLTNKGLLKVQKILQVQNLYNSEEPWINFILNALKGKHLFIKDIHYLVKNNEVIIVDEFTGRVMPGRKWGDGLHAAIEAKEMIYNSLGSQTIASITYQNFFSLYPKLSGMTGTAKTEELEFEEIYNLPVSVIPTFKPIQRQDLTDLIYIDEVSKWEAVANECKAMYAIGRPVLVGTTTIQNSEILSHLLLRENIPHRLLNARPENIKKEAEVVAQAGCLFSITIATNMAGRGTDVILGGNVKFKAKRYLLYIIDQILNNKRIKKDAVTNLEIMDSVKKLYQYKNILEQLRPTFEKWFETIDLENEVFNSNYESYYQFEKIIKSLYQNLFDRYQTICNNERQKILELGGLYVIGTERHESRRIDNQLRGRAGRQGDPGASRFFLCLNDSLLRIFGGDQLKNLMQTFQVTDEALESEFLTQSLESAQQKVEGFYYDQRKNLNKYDKVLNKQRSILYRFRRRILFAKNVRDIMLELGETLIDDLIQILVYNDTKLNFKASSALRKRVSYLLHALNISFDSTMINSTSDLENLKQSLYQQLWTAYTSKELQFWFYDQNLFRQYEKLTILKYIDTYWSKHLENINFIRDSVAWEVYAQRDPFLLYQEETYRSLNKTFKNCRDAIFYDLLTSEIKI